MSATPPHPRVLRMRVACPDDLEQIELDPVTLSAPGSDFSLSFLPTTLLVAHRMGRHPDSQEEQRFLASGQLSERLVNGVLPRGVMLELAVFLDRVGFAGQRAVVSISGWDRRGRAWEATERWSPHADPALLSGVTWSIQSDGATLDGRSRDGSTQDETATDANRRDTGSLIVGSW